ncbi:GPW/gp25 family protein [Myroides profundi]|uniref:Gene 25-like lysozyme n=1 Tax=Myroides profundi TaxID=480520 RepID=A0AAJ4W5G5_MYRPR|nr:GPW/gp25 family protein [Myroides profundi]AJH15254.1 GPW/gp25 family protein [Myroides profundi]SER25379.1 Gene 25-like lysozyme [Myroides profundi]
MQNTFYKFPFNPELAMSEGASLPTCSLAESIAQNVMLLVLTRKGENRFNPDYGNAVWDLEFDNAVTLVEWERVFEESLLDQIKKYEPRIIFPKIQVHMEYVEHNYGTKDFVEIRKKAKIGVNAVLTDIGELFTFSTHIYLSPMSVD